MSPRGDVSVMTALDVVIMIIVSPGSCSTQHLGTPRQPPRQPPSRDPSGGRAAQVKPGAGGGDYLNNVTTRSLANRSTVSNTTEIIFYLDWIYLPMAIAIICYEVSIGAAECR